MTRALRMREEPQQVFRAEDHREGDLRRAQPLGPPRSGLGGGFRLTTLTLRRMATRSRVSKVAPRALRRTGPRTVVLECASFQIPPQPMAGDQPRGLADESSGKVRGTAGVRSIVSPATDMFRPPLPDGGRAGNTETRGISDRCQRVGAAPASRSRSRPLIGSTLGNS